MNSDRDRWLHALENPPHVDDDGFTDGVLRALPPRRTASRARFVLVPSFALVGCAAARALTRGSVPLLAAQLAEGHEGALTAAMAVGSMAVLLVLGAWSAARESAWFTEEACWLKGPGAS